TFNRSSAGNSDIFLVKYTGIAAMSVPVAVRVEDGHGGVDTPSFEKSVGKTPPGGVRGPTIQHPHADGGRGTEETRPTGWTIYLDDNRNHKRDSGERFTTTDANGNYSFTNLAPGTYVVAEEAQPGWVQTAPNGGTHTVTVGSGQVVTGLDFGNRQSTEPQ